MTNVNVGVDLPFEFPIRARSIFTAKRDRQIMLQEQQNRELEDYLADIAGEVVFRFVNTVDVLDIPDTFTPIAMLDVGFKPAGIYMVGAAVSWTFDRMTEYVEQRWRINGGDWNEQIVKPNDVDEKHNDYYAFPDLYEDGPFLLEFEMRKETMLGTLDLQRLSLFIQRVR